MKLSFDCRTAFQQYELSEFTKSVDSAEDYERYTYAVMIYDSYKSWFKKQSIFTRIKSFFENLTLFTGKKRAIISIMKYYNDSEMLENVLNIRMLEDGKIEQVKKKFGLERG